MQKGYKRNGKGMAVLRFFIGLIILAILLGVVYFFLQKVDYSDKLTDPDATMRPYVEMTASPDAVAEPDDTEEGEEDIVFTNIISDEGETTDADLFGDDPDEFIDLTAEEETATPEPTEEPTPEPTAEPTPEPTPVPTATPEPTKIAEKGLAKAKNKGLKNKLPEATSNENAVMTSLYISEPNNNKVVEVKGYCYSNETEYDCATAQLYLVLKNKTTGDVMAYKCTTESGASGVDHSVAICKNADKSDFVVRFSVSYFKDFDWGLGMVAQYKGADGKDVTVYYDFGEGFSTKGGKAVVAQSGFQTEGESEDAFPGMDAGEGEEIFDGDTAEDVPSEPQTDVFEGDVSELDDFFNADEPVVTQVG